MSLPSILVVDDDPLFGRFVLGILGEAGYSTAVATTPRTAILLVHSATPNVAIVDYSQPRTDGFGLFERMRSIRPQLRGILVTGHGSEALAFQAGQRGFAAYLPKPFERAQIVKLVAEVLAVPCRTAGDGSLRQAVPYGARRVAAQIARVARAEEDVRTTAEWGRLVGASSGALRGWCQAARVRPSNALRLGRALRACRLATGRLSAADVVDFADLRAREKFLDNAGLKDRQPPSIDHCLIRQRFVSQPLLIAEVRSALGIGLPPS